MNSIVTPESSKEMYEILYFHFYHNKPRRNTLVQLCLRVLNTHDEQWKTGLSEHLTRVTNEVSPEIYFRIKQQCLKNGLLPIPETSETLAALSPYQTYNLIPCSIQSEPAVGSLITVKINPDFDLRDADPRFRHYFRSMEQYEIALEQYNKDLEIHNKEELEKNKTEKSNNSLLILLSLITKPKEPLKPSEPYRSRKNFNIQSHFPSYSANPDSSANPQGDINWMIDYLPESIRDFFGFSRDGDRYTFPDIMGINQGIHALNQLAVEKGFEDPFIPFTLVEVDGEISPGEYLPLIGKGLLPVSRPNSLSSWFYHDLLYHVIGLFLTPQHLLLKLLKIAQYSSDVSISDRSQKRLAQLIDNATSWSRRVVGIEYDKTHSSVEFYGYSISNPMSEKLSYNYLLGYCFLALFGGDSEKDMLAFLRAMDKDDFYDVHYAIINKLDSKIIFNTLLAYIKENINKIEKIISINNKTTLKTFVA